MLFSYYQAPVAENKFRGGTQELFASPRSRGDRRYLSFAADERNNLLPDLPSLVGLQQQARLQATATLIHYNKQHYEAHSPENQNCRTNEAI